MPPSSQASQPRPDGRWLVVASRFNELVANRLLDAALAFLKEAGVPDEEVQVQRVPGAFEIPQALQRLLGDRGEGWAGAVAVGAVVRGETPHFDFLCREVSRGLMSVALETRVPIGFGVLTCDTLEQALARAGGDMGNKGREAASAAYEVACIPRAR